MRSTVFASLICVLLPLALTETPYSPQETYGAPDFEQSFSSASGSALPPPESQADAEPPKVVYVINHIPHITLIEKPGSHHHASLVHHHGEAVHGHVPVVHGLHHAGHVAHHPVPYVYGHGVHHVVPVVHDGHHHDVQHVVPVVHDGHHHDVHHAVPIVHEDSDDHHSVAGAHHIFPAIYFSAPDAPVAHDHHVVHHDIPVVHHNSSVVHHPAPPVHH